MNPIKEALAAAGRTHDGHVTNGSLEAQWNVICDAWAKQDYEVCQILGKALNYPWYMDDRKNFPDAGISDGVCTGDHTSVTLAQEAADQL